MKKWRINRPDPVKTAEFMNKCDLKSLTLDVMTSRGFTDFDSLADFFKGEELSDPFLIKDMAIAAEVINKAVDQYDLIVFTVTMTAMELRPPLYFTTILKAWAQTLCTIFLSVRLDMA